MKNYEFETLINAFYSEHRTLSNNLDKNTDRGEVVKQLGVLNKILTNMEQYKKLFIDSPKEEINHLKKSSK